MLVDGLTPPPKIGAHFVHACLWSILQCTLVGFAQKCNARVGLWSSIYSREIVSFHLDPDYWFLSSCLGYPDEDS